MIEDFDFVRQAWPQGYLAKRGVWTMVRWLCVFADPNSHAIFRTWQGVEARLDFATSKWTLVGDTGTTIERHLEWGDLLPEVNIHDAATWACLLEDLAEAENPGFEWKAVQLSWKPEIWRDGPETDKRGWQLHGTLVRKDGQPGPLGPFTGWRYVLDTKDPEEALVRARIALREREPRSGGGQQA